MTYEELRKRVLAARPGDWIRNEVPRAGVGDVAVLSTELDIRIERDDTDDREEFEEPWAQRFPNRNAYSLSARLYWGSSLITVRKVVVVDGGHAILPLPESDDDLRISRWRYAIAQALNRLPPVNRLDEYLRRAGITVDPALDDEDR